MIVDRIIGSLVAKGIVSGAKTIYENTGERRRQKEFNEKLNYFRQRNLISAIIIYVIGYLFCRFLLGVGIIGAILVLLGFLGHFNNLNDVRKYIDVKREYILSTILLLLLGMSFLGYL